ncbi:hypothetical protein VB711_12425 [Cronbergia sp. UHCC 0137]|uniref:hypothetical protein n=1 Tax=Cronbergia sp. UHCC 0137 TaxID=3110239 RepID=UPI002B1FB034|nr:hypothetical protein [Cronbergia sp. UHCC 0137]MEA5618636.1 hypothetical protein [Cronbergia sp. UHCC 0137]
MPLFADVVTVEQYFPKLFFVSRLGCEDVKRSIGRKSFIVGMIIMNQEYEVRCQHFACLKEKYQAHKYQDCSPSSLLYLILRKADLGLELSNIELDWLQKNQLTKTTEIIWLDKFRKGELKRLEDEFSQLKAKYRITKSWESSLNSFLYPILWKLNSEGILSDVELELLQHNNLFQIVELAQSIKHFADLKQKYQANKYQDSFPDQILYKILKKLDKFQPLDDPEYEWLLDNELLETIEIFEQQDSERKATFIQLKQKYKATKHSDVSPSSQLYEILQKLEQNQKLNQHNLDWLKNEHLTETIEIAKELEIKKEFIALKKKYKAEKYIDLSPSNHLYTILKKFDLGHPLSKDDLDFLQKNQLIDTLIIAKDKYATSLKTKAELEQFLNDSEIEWLHNNKHEDIIAFAKNKQFIALKRKYGLIDPLLPLEPFYAIMIKLEKRERLDPVLVFRLMDEGLLSRGGKIAIAYYRLEAEFSEQELKRTGNKWNIPTASSYWRKANEAELALKLTNLDLAKITENNLKSAILVTRGAALRDINELNDAEDCARKAIEYQPDSHQPYTLMGAICYDKNNHEEGDYWFELAVENGAETEDIDAERKRIIKSTKDEQKRHEAAEYLLKKDPKRYAWAKDYLKKQKNKT